MLSEWAELALQLPLHMDSDLDGSKTRIPTGIRLPSPSLECLALRGTCSLHNSYVLGFSTGTSHLKCGTRFLWDSQLPAGQCDEVNLISHWSSPLSSMCLLTSELLLKGEPDQDFQRSWVNLKTTVSEYARGNISGFSFPWRVFSTLSENQALSRYLTLHTQNYWSVFEKPFCRFGHSASYESESASHLTWTTYIFKLNWVTDEKMSCPSGALAQRLRCSQTGRLLEPGLLKYFGIFLSNSEKGAQTGSCGREGEVI